MSMNNNTACREVFDGFSGLGLSSRGKTSCRLDNFRVLADGSLEKREGIRHLASLPRAVRGICSFPEGGEDVILAVAGNTLYRIRKNGETLSTSCFVTEEGEVGSFWFGGRLYFLDGKSIYRYEGNGVAVEVHGYTPLYGKNWSTFTTEDHTVNEPLNTLSPYVRLHFRVIDSVRQIEIGFGVKEIDWILADGVKINSSRYQLTNGKNAILFSELIYASEIEVSATVSTDGYTDSTPSSCRRAAVYEDFENSRVFFFGGQDSTQFFATEPRSAAVLARDRALYPLSCGLYVPLGRGCSLEGGEPITAICRCQDRMLLFFPSSLWASEVMDEAAGESILFSPVCSHLGCSANGAAVMTGTSAPITVSRGGVYRLRIDPDLLEECESTRLSDAVEPFFSGASLADVSVCYHHRRGELWFAAKGADNILLYAPERKAWYCYGGIFVERLFAFGDGVGFSSGSEVFVFDEALCVDMLSDGAHLIEAVFESGWLDFDDTGAEKRAEGLVITAALSGGELMLSLSDGTPLGEEKISGKHPVPFGIYDCRLPTGRFRATRLTIRALGPMRERIYRAELLAQKGKK
ncbi:MAG: hypothetical protein J6D16_06090 [Clostridia bacterium]|nr:hypothetical protein [Clostridia bacterium]